MIYFDNSATTKVYPNVLATYNKVSNDFWGNPSSLHNLGQESFNLLTQARHQIAQLLHTQDSEIFFTSGGTEGDNWVIKGTALAKRNYGNHIISSTIEHPAVKESLKQLEQLGYDVTYLPVDSEGKISPKDLKAAIRPTTILVTLIAVNNEVGSIAPIDKVSQVLEDYPKIHFHLDAVQTVGKGLTKEILNKRVDFLTFSGHKFHAPRGIGFVYGKKGRKLTSLLTGGGQESNRRSGTENLPSIVAMSKALRLALDNEADKVNTQKQIRTMIYDHLHKLPNVVFFSKLNNNFAPHILCFAIKGVRGEVVVHALEQFNIYVSTTSACSSKSNKSSSTLQAMRVPDELAAGAVRISLDENNTLEQAQQFNVAFDKVYQQLNTINKSKV